MRNGLRRSGVVLACLLPLAGCLDWSDVDDYLPSSTGAAPSEPQPAPPTQPAELCGLANLAEVVALDCADELTSCELWEVCPNVSTPLEQCLAERQELCELRVRYALQAGACYRPEVNAANQENGCYESWRRYYGACTLPTLEELAWVAELCEDEWTPGRLLEGESCTYGAAGCAAPDSAALASSCFYETSATELDGGVCTWRPELPRGAECDPVALEYCNGTDACLSTGVCGRRRELGESCEQNNDCSSRLCAAGVCTDPEGTSCAEGSCPISWTCIDQRCTRQLRF